MDKCPITKKPFDCKNCKAIEDHEECPYMTGDQWVANSLTFMRKLVEKEVADKIKKEYIKREKGG